MFDDVSQFLNEHSSSDEEYYTTPHDVVASGADNPNTTIQDK